MQVKFLSPVSLDGVDYKPGTHEIPKSFASHWYFLALLNKGTALILDAGKTKIDKKAATTPPAAIVTPPVETKGNGDLPADADITSPEFDEETGEVTVEEPLDDEDFEGTGDGTEEGDDDENFDDDETGETSDDEENFDEPEESTEEEEEEEPAPAKKSKKKAAKKKAKKKK